MDGRVTKHFWFARIVSRMISAGIARKSVSNSPISTTGHSTSPDTSSSRPSSSTNSSPLAKAMFFASARMISLRRSASMMTFAASSFAA